MDEPLLTQPGGPALEAPPTDTAAGYGEAGRLPIVPPQPDGTGLDDDLALDSPWPTVGGWWMLAGDGD
ncbi:MAG TPA: hypothetical protein VF276_18480 [Chloroflexia bacterium]